MAETAFTPQHHSVNIEDAEPLLPNTNASIEGNHNDPELSIQKTVYNLNNRNVRITLWCIIYVILTAASIQIGTKQYIYFTDDWEVLHDEPWYRNNMEKLYSLSVSSNSILCWAAAILMLNLYCICCKCRCSPIVATLFVIGGVMQAVTAGDGIYVDCRWDSDKAGNGYCKVKYIALYLWIVLFSFYLAIDTMFSIGNNIRIRIFVKSFIICIRSFLIFLIENYRLQQYRGPNTEHSEKFDLRSAISCYFLLFFWCLMLMIILAMRYAEKDNSNKKLNIWVRRIVGWGIIGSTGVSLGVSGVYVIAGYGIYYVPGAVLLVYDLQYL